MRPNNQNKQNSENGKHSKLKVFHWPASADTNSAMRESRYIYTTRKPWLKTKTNQYCRPFQGEKDIKSDNFNGITTTRTRTRKEQKESAILKKKGTSTIILIALKYLKLKKICIIVIYINVLRLSKLFFVNYLNIFQDKRTHHQKRICNLYIICNYLFICPTNAVLFCFLKELNQFKYTYYVFSILSFTRYLPFKNIWCLDPTTKIYFWKNTNI